jgi:glycosyltransferase involved in cell wall biosynthesis
LTNSLISNELPKISVLLITYNHIQFIATAIDSVLNQQTSFPFEIVIGDDCSTDGTTQIVREYQKRHSEKIRLVLPDVNLGFGGNRLFLEILTACRGEYVALLDGDDYWTNPLKLQKQAAFLDEHPECVLCFHSVYEILEDGDIEPRRSNVGQGTWSTLDDLLGGNFIETCSAMIRRNAVNSLPMWLETMEPQDWALYILAASQGTIGFVDEAMAVYRRHRGSLWYGMSPIEHLENGIAFLERINRELDFKYDSAIRMQLSRRWYELSLICYQKGEYDKAAVNLKKCLSERQSWMEEYLPNVGAKGPRVWKHLDRMLWLYRHPRLARSYKHASGPVEAIRWGMMLICIRIGRLVRSQRGLSQGSIKADPNPVRSAYPGPVSTTLSWSSSGAEKVDVRIGGPAGQLFSQFKVSHGITTGSWVTDRMTVFLQDCSGRNALTMKHTLDVIKIRVIYTARTKRH